ncbi:unnamed protein product, partial [Cuscuta campestris]
AHPHYRRPPPTVTAAHNPSISATIANPIRLASKSKI